MSAGDRNLSRTDELIALARPTFGDAELAAVAEVLASGWVAGQGPRGADLEAAMAAHCGVGHAVAVSSCTAALHLSLVALGVGPGDEVIVADYTYPATGHAVLYCGATPVFADVRPDTWTLDPEAAAAAIGPRTVGIVAVDTFGQCADYDELGTLARRHGLFLLADAAAGIGARYRGRPAGSLADVTCFSLHARKGITSGEGGVVVTDDAALAAAVRARSCFGVRPARERERSDELEVPVFDVLGWNYKLSELQAAVALVQLGRLPELLAARARVAARYTEALAGGDGPAPPTVGEGRTHAWQSYVVTLPPGVDRGPVARTLRAAGVQCNIGTFASHRQPVYRTDARCPVSADCFARHLAIPMHAGLTDAQVDRVIDALAEAVDAARSRHAPEAVR